MLDGPNAPRVYLAGPMYPDGEDHAVAPWRVRIRVELPDFLTEWVVPEAIGQHGGDTGYVVEEDLRTIASCHGVVALLDDAVDRPGTCVEIGYARGCGLPVAVVMRENQVNGDLAWFPLNAATRVVFIPEAAPAEWWNDPAATRHVVEGVRAFLASVARET